MASIDSDVLAKLLYDATNPSEAKLYEIENDVKMIRNIINRRGSQSAVGDFIRDSSSASHTMRDRHDEATNNSLRPQNRKYGSFSDEITKAFKDGLIKSLFSTSTTRQLQQTLVNKFGEGFDLKQFKGKLGEEVGQKLLKASGAESAFEELSVVFDKALVGFNTTLDKGGSLTDALSRSAQIIGNNSSSVAAGLGEVATSLGPFALAAIYITYELNELSEAVSYAQEGITELTKAASTASMSTYTTRQKEAKLASERLKADINTLVTQPFELLKESATSLTSAFDNNLKIITATQGYTKSDVQSLMSSYAARLTKEGLTDIISTSSLTDNLSKVLSAGLSGKIAEEFAYQATILGNAIPTQDFFGYASTYSSIAANAIRLGKSEEDAIKEANDSLSAFANNLLYASRQLAGGYSTGLTNAQSLYEQSVKISQAARSGNISGISGVMTAVSAIIGATAPDLANSITDAIYSAAVGGNSSSVVALRSLAGINASNTEFLQALAKDPQGVFATLFNNLANMFNDSTDAYMEKAQGYAELFGLSQEALQRIDFNYLAQTIKQMNDDSSALNQNMELMVAGETTLTAEQLKNRQINQYMLENGLSYVLDNEAARAIQQHMWDEQLARELQETEYGVNLQGAAMEALTGILNTINRILSIISLQNIREDIDNLIVAAEDSSALQNELLQVIQLGNLGASNATTLHALTTRGEALGLTSSLVELLGGTRVYGTSGSHILSLFANGGTTRFANRNTDLLTSWGISLLNNPGQVLDGLVSTDAYSSGGGSNNSWWTTKSDWWGSYSPSSRYAWGTIGKSTSKLVSGLLNANNSYVLGNAYTGTGKTAQQTALASKLGRLITQESIKGIVEAGGGYEDLAKKAKQMGISNLSDALSSAGYDETAVKNLFSDVAANISITEAQRRQDVQMKYYEVATPFFETSFVSDFQTPLFDILNSMNERWDTWREAWDTHQSTVKKYVTEWTKYYIDHVYYDEAFGGKDYYKKVADVQQREQAQKGDAIYALAEALTANTADLKDPTVQTNALLSQILVVLNAIMQQNNNTGSASGIAETLAAFAVGIKLV